MFELDQVEDGPGQAADQEDCHDDEQDLALVALVRLGLAAVAGRRHGQLRLARPELANRNDPGRRGCQAAVGGAGRQLAVGLDSTLLLLASKLLDVDLVLRSRLQLAGFVGSRNWK